MSGRNSFCVLSFYFILFFLIMVMCKNVGALKKKVKYWLEASIL